MGISFADEIEVTLGPFLRDEGFEVNEVDDSPDAGGQERHILFYKSDDCKLQVLQIDPRGRV